MPEKKEKDKEEEQKKNIIKDILRLNRQYQAEYNTNRFIRRDYYCPNSKFHAVKEKINKFFGTWSKAKEIARDQEKLDVCKEVGDEERLGFEQTILEQSNKIKDLEIEKSLLLNDKITDDEVCDLIFSEKERLIQFAPLKVKDVNTDSPVEAILMLSDWHAAETVVSEEIGGINEYNIDIFKQCVDRVFFYFLHYCKKHNVTKAHIPFMGDLFAGEIHDELIRTNEAHVVETLFILLDYISEKILQIEPHFSSVDIHFLVGNHARLYGGRPPNKQAATKNWEYVLGRVLKRMVKNSELNKKFRVHTYESLFTVIEVCGRKFLTLHGNILTGKGTGGFAGIPFYSLMMNAAKFYGAMSTIGMDDGTPFHDLLMGHLHTSARIVIFNGGTGYLNGAPVGANEYSLHNIRAASRSEQTLLFVCDGRVIGEHLLWCR
jgi:hypothetical protein